MTQSNPHVLEAAKVVSDSKDVPATAVHMQFSESYHWGDDQSIGFGEVAA